MNYPDEKQVFRDENGQAFGEVALRLSLEDFVSERIMGKTRTSNARKRNNRSKKADKCLTN